MLPAVARAWILFISFVLFTGAFSCQSNRFRGSAAVRGNSVPENPPLDLSKDDEIPENPQPGLGEDPKTGEVPGNGTLPILTERVFEIGCDVPANVSQSFSAPIGRRIKASVRGQICPESTANLHIMFIVDFSGSMGPHFDDETNSNHPGNDPLRNGSCGRLQAGESLVNYILDERTRQGGDGHHKIFVSMIPFANVAVEKMVVEPVEIEQFKKNYLNKKHFCRYVAQDGYESFGESLNWLDLGFTSAVESSTNYAAAFNRARQMLPSISKNAYNTSVYFISDGKPTAPGSRQEALDAGIKAGTDLRNDSNIKNTIINGLYLGSSASSAYGDAESVLTKVTGSDRVLPAEDAEKLAEKILEFPKPEINLDATKYAEMASVSIDPFGEKPLGIRYLKEVKAGVWEYETQPFVLLGKKSVPVDNVVSINIFGEDGFLFKSVLNIIYTQE